MQRRLKFFAHHGRRIILSDIMPGGYTPKDTWSESDWNIFTTWLRSMLLTEIVKVSFVKKDGTVRDMVCTLQQDILPELARLPDGVERRRVSSTTMSVFDIEANGWRSFTVRDVTSISFTMSSTDDQYPFPMQSKP